MFDEKIIGHLKVFKIAKLVAVYWDIVGPKKKYVFPVSQPYPDFGVWNFLNRCIKFTFRSNSSEEKNRNSNIVRSIQDSTSEFPGNFLVSGSANNYSAIPQVLTGYCHICINYKKMLKKKKNRTTLPRFLQEEIGNQHNFFGLDEGDTNILFLILEIKYMVSIWCV